MGGGRAGEVPEGWGEGRGWFERATKEELVGEEAQPKEWVDAKRQSEEAPMQAPFYPLPAGAACGCQGALVTEWLAPLRPVVDQLNWVGIQLRSIRRGGGASDCHIDGEGGDGGAQVGRGEGVGGDADADISGALRGARDAGFPCDSGVVWRDAG